MGDILHALPAVESLRQSFPKAHIDWVVKPRWMPLLEGTVSMIAFERDWASLRRVRLQTYDVAIDFQGLMQSAVITWLAKTPLRVGLHRSQARESLAALAYNKAVRTTSVHRVDQNLELARAAGATVSVTATPVPVGKPEGELPDGPFVLASPEAGWKSKQWPMEYYADLAKRLPIPLVLNAAPNAQINVPGARIHRSSIAGLIDATRRATAVIGVDSGPMHLAAALRKPGVAIFGPTDPASHGPYGGSLTVLRDPQAVTSYARRDEVDPSMRAIRPQAVLEALAL